MVTMTRHDWRIESCSLHPKSWRWVDTRWCGWLHIGPVLILSWCGVSRTTASYSHVTIC